MLAKKMRALVDVLEALLKEKGVNLSSKKTREFARDIARMLVKWRAAPPENKNRVLKKEEGRIKKKYARRS